MRCFIARSSLSLLGGLAVVIAAEPIDFVAPAPSATAPSLTSASAATAANGLDLYVRSLEPTAEERGEIDALALVLLEVSTDLQLGLVERASVRYNDALKRIEAMPRDKRRRLAEPLRPVVLRMRELSNPMMKALVELSEATLSATAAAKPPIDPARR